MELYSYLVANFSRGMGPVVAFKVYKVFVVMLIAFTIARVSHSAPSSKRKEMWNPYYYPTARSLSIPPTTTTTTTTIPTTTTTTTHRPKPRQIVRFPADRRTSRSLNSTNLNNNVNAISKDPIKFETGNVTAINHALNDFIKAAEVLIRELLISTNSGLLKVIGQMDQSVSKFQKRLQTSGLKLAFAGQKAAAQTYEALPPFVNKFIQRLGTPTDGRSREQVTAQLNEAVQNLRQLKKMFLDAFDEHEKDFHNVFQDRFSQINQYLRVPELPRRPLAWYS